MIAVTLALAGALAYGVSDFIGGLMSRRASLWPIALTACLGALAGSVVLALSISGHPHPSDFAWALVAGVGAGAGTGFLYRGMAAGRMAVTAPISAVGAAAIPVLAGLIGGERPGPVVWLGIALAFPAIWLVASESDPHPDARPGTSGALDGVLAGIGFGLSFACLGQVPEHSGYWPLATAEAAAVVAVVAICFAMGGNPWPRRPAEYTGLVGGLLAALAIWCFLLATHRGMLTVSSVVVSLYPASTVVLAVTLLREHIHRSQAYGLLLCAATVALVAAG